MLVSVAMKNTRVWVLGTALLLGGCGGSEVVEPDAGGPASSEGGMDGAGSFFTELYWDKGIFVQTLWQDGQPAFLLSNLRAEPAEIEVYAGSCSDEGCSMGERLITWQLAVGSTRTASNEELTALTEHLSIFVSEEVRLGMLLGLGPTPRASSLGFTSSMGINASGNPVTQIETGFLTAPGSAFTLTIDLLPGTTGKLVLLTKHPDIESLAFVDVVAVRSQVAVVEQTGDGFTVLLPFAPPDESPVRVDVDVAIPTTFSGHVIGFNAGWCPGTHYGERCDAYRVTRLIPLVEPLR